MSHAQTSNSAFSGSSAKLAFASLGVVFGDIGTSPLYAMREALHHVIAAGGDLRSSVLGVVSLLLWALFIVVTLKYVVMLMRADNRGEGGILSLVVLVQTTLKKKSGLILALGIVGAAFFFGDAMITPAMSVLSAIEGLRIINPAFDPFVVPITLGVLFTLFLFQYKGTSGVAAIFAPVTMIWFILLAVIGLSHIADDFEIFSALNPLHGVAMLIAHPGLALLVFGGVFLAVTGGEALYADMGHFGRKPIRMAWTCVVLPSLICNYLGQGAFVISHPEAAHNPFFLMIPQWGLVPLVILATMVTVIASQAVITGAFSIAQQAIALGIFPRMYITHTSESESGQIYIGQINWMIMVGVIFLVLVFKTSDNLASAYGLAVNTSMLVDTALGIVFFWQTRSWPRSVAIPALVFIFVVEATFYAANLLKIPHGGYMPVLIGGVAVVLMMTWLRGVSLLSNKLRKESIELDSLLESLERRPPARVAGAAVFLQTDNKYAPSALMHNLKHNRVLHDKLIFIAVKTASQPRWYEDRVSVRNGPMGAWIVEATFGYMEQPDVPAALRACAAHGLEVDPRQASYFLGRRVIRPSARSAMPFWQQRLFIMLANQSARAIEFFRLPPDRVVELGMQLSV
ncbi:potassium transporter Kup [Aestuariivirga litoralis]|uniref:potassium transporter Kup n=1 Tax=Aestuariivirga litoralis TaxID=2650924 RepID=UPI0018C60BB2|nr:potassium transporter Kup [Aestuariivirga litoralis]MBG1231177.1 potassium transporter Kup [Aestuariivirga litoralis]